MMKGQDEMKANSKTMTDANVPAGGHRSPLTADRSPGSNRLPLTADRLPWYKQLWPWLVIAPPLASVIAGIALISIAIASDDGLVTPDYYKQGISINERLTREQAANCAVKDRACMNAPVKDGR